VWGSVPLAVIFVFLEWRLMVNVLYRFKLDAIPSGRGMIQSRQPSLNGWAKARRSSLAHSFG
jgi:hypothetical protein